MKKIALWCSVLLVTIGTVSASAIAGSDAVNSYAGAGPMPIEYEGKPLLFSSAPKLAGSHLMVPVREIADMLNVTVEWNDETKTVTTRKDSTIVEWTMNQPEVKRNEKPYSLEQAPYLESGKVYVPLRAFSENFGLQALWNETAKRIKLQQEWTGLPTVGSADKLQSLLKESMEQGYPTGGYGIATDMTLDVKSAVPAAQTESAGPAPESKTADAGRGSFSTTNVQVDGVDEADVIKTDGTYLYQVNRQRVLVSQAVPAGEMKIVSTLDFSDQMLMPIELYVDEKRLVVIGTAFVYTDPLALNSMDRSGLVRPGPNKTAVKAVIYDLTDKSNLKKLRELEIKGNYSSSRKIGDSLYLIANQWLQMPVPMDNLKDRELQKFTPEYRDSAVGDSFVDVSYDKIRYFPDAVVPNYLIVGGVDLSDPSQPIQISSYLGSGNTVYASEENLYVAVTQYKYGNSASGPDSEKKKMMAPQSVEMNTLVYKFGLNQGRVLPSGSGTVPGTLLNQFSLDEHDGYLRIATTKGNMWRTDENTSKNNIYILDASMQLTGQLEDLAPGEKIYSTRFMGDRAYMVTFKKVDPLFVLDLHDPKAPKVLGKLKIPGYSDYLHPYDENHLLGFGKDAVEAANEWDPNGSTTAYYQGMKIAVFDVTDVENPVEMFKETIGARGTDSELLHNHKALLFSKEKGLLAFPVTVMENKNAAGASNVWDYGQFSFQGMYVYRLDLQSGFRLQGKISHLNSEQLEKAGGGWYESERNIERGLYIDDVLYTVSPGMIRASSLTSLDTISELTIPKP